MSIRPFFTKQTILGVLLFSSISGWAQPGLELMSVIEAATENDPWLGQSSYKQNALMEDLAKSVLSEFRKYTLDNVVWVKPERYWRYRVPEDEPGRETRG